MTPEEFTTLIETYIEPFTVMLAIATGGNPLANDVISNATGSLVYTGRRDLLVTNHHVYAEFISRRGASSETVLMMSGADGFHYLDISEAEVLGTDRGRDLAVLHVPRRHVLGQGKWFSVFPSWPPRRPEAGMLAVLYGYPGEGRVPQGDVMGASALSIGLPVASVSDGHFVMADTNGDAHSLVPDGQDPLTSFGGISGSAVYVMVKETATTRPYLFLGGFAYEASGSGMICVTHADHINADGSIC
jgi:hypothetical protein